MLVNSLFVIIGSSLLLLAVTDFAVTAFVPTSEGRVTSFVGGSVYRIFLWLSGCNGYKRILNYIGLVSIFAISLTWILLLWSGFTFIYLADTDSILVGSDKTPADVFEKIYHVGYTLSTLGIGDFVPGNDFWRVFTSAISFVGLVTITMCITYLVPVISNAIHKRSLSLQISSLGETPEEIVINSYNGTDFSEAEDLLSGLSSDIFLYAQNQIAYPILYHMHSSNPSENIVLKLAALDEALTIFMFHTPPQQRPSRLQIRSARRAITAYLETIAYKELVQEQPPPPRFHLIEEYTNEKLERTTSPHLDEVYQALDKRRRLWHTAVQHDGWQWKDIHGEKYVTDLDATYTNKLMQS